MNAHLLSTVGLLLGLTLAGCEDLPLPTPVAAQDGYIAFIGASEDDPYWPLLRATAERYRAALGGLRLITRSPLTPSAEAQIRLLRELPTSSMRGLCIVPADPDALGETLCELRTRGVSVGDDVPTRHLRGCPALCGY